jgi:cell division protein FtsW
MKALAQVIHNIKSRIQGDRVIWILVLLLSIVSLLAVYSSTGTLAFKYKAGNTEYYLLKHLSLLVFGLVLMYLAHLADYRVYSRIAQFLLILSIPLLLYTLFFGTELNDAKRWITLPGINLSFQTSDLAKLALIMYTARFLSRNQEHMDNFRKGFLPIILTITGVCVLIAPANLSSAVELFFTCLMIMFIGRVRLKFLGATAGIGLAAIGLVILLSFTFPDSGRMGTWKARIESHFGGNRDDQYQVQQSKIAIAEGGVLGKGPGNSTQRNFLPHPYSDFIFSIIVEEYGLLGAAALMLLYLVFFWRIMKLLVKSPGTFGAMVALGLGLALCIQAFANMAVAVNLMPVTGLTLPLVSMGGTSIWFTSIAIGIILSVSRSTEKQARQLDQQEQMSEAA